MVAGSEGVSSSCCHSSADTLAASLVPGCIIPLVTITLLLSELPVWTLAATRGHVKLT